MFSDEELQAIPAMCRREIQFVENMAATLPQVQIRILGHISLMAGMAAKAERILQERAQAAQAAEAAKKAEEAKKAEAAAAAPPEAKE